MKNKKLLIGLGIAAAAVIGIMLYNKKKKTQGAPADTPSTPQAPAEPKPKGNLGIDNIPKADLDYIRQNTGMSDFRGVDYNDSRNTESANATYLAANPDIAAGWSDKTADGKVIGWSHYIIYGKKEGRNWSV